MCHITISTLVLLFCHTCSSNGSRGINCDKKNINEHAIISNKLPGGQLEETADMTQRHSLGVSETPRHMGWE